MSALDEQPEQPLCIHFVNTVSRHDGSGRNDRLADFEKTLAWTAQARLLTQSQARRFSRWGREHRAQADRFAREAVAFREYLFDLFVKSAATGRVSPGGLTRLNELLGTPALSRSLEVDEDGAVVDAYDCGDGLMAPLQKIAVSASGVLTDGSWRRIIRCDRDECDWLAVDASRNHSRRYCTAAGCGNLARVTRHYRRLKRGAARRKQAAGGARRVPG